MKNHRQSRFVKNRVAIRKICHLFTFRNANHPSKEDKITCTREGTGTATGKDSIRLHDIFPPVAIGCYASVALGENTMEHRRRGETATVGHLPDRNLRAESQKPFRFPQTITTHDLTETLAETFVENPGKIATVEWQQFSYVHQFEFLAQIGLRLLHPCLYGIPVVG